MRVWELEQKRLVPQGLLSVSPQGFLQVTQGPIAVCDVDSDPLAIRRSVVPELPEWLRDFLISTLTSVYGIPPHCCKPFHQVLLHSREEADDTGLTLGLLQFFFTQSTTGLRILLDRLDTFATQVRTHQYIPPEAYPAIDDAICLLVGSSELLEIPNRVVVFLAYLRSFQNDRNRGESVMLYSLDSALLCPYKSLLDKLEKVKGWADKVVDTFEVPNGQSVETDEDEAEEN